jgi:IrrE N-terminal-like domain
VTAPRKFKAPFIPKERIWQEADRVRAAYPAAGPLPIGWGEGVRRTGEVLSCIVQVLDLAEFDLGLDLIPTDGLREHLDIDALLMGDLKSILVDKGAFMSPRLEYRLRFSVAHEIGHLILHRDIYGGLKHASVKEWFDYISAIPEVEYGWVEWQAYEFAGRLLVPPEPLREAFQAAIQSAQAAGYSDWLAADEAAADYIATCIAPRFLTTDEHR